MKRILCAFLSLFLLCSLAMPAFALSETENTENVTIIAEVPSSHKITVETDGGAAVIYNEKAVTEFDAPRLGTPKIIIRAESGYAVESVTLGDIDITDKLKGGVYIFDPVNRDQTLTVVTEEGSAPVQTDTYTVVGTITENGEPLSGVTLELRSKLKTSVSDKDGRFRFEDVEAAHHSLIAIKNGNIIGYMEFTLSSAGNVDFTLSNGIYSVHVPDGTATIDLALTLEDGRAIALTDVTAREAPVTPDAKLPQTGDSSTIWLWIMLAAVSCTVLMLYAVGIPLRRKKEN